MSVGLSSGSGGDPTHDLDSCPRHLGHSPVRSAPWPVPASATRAPTRGRRDAPRRASPRGAAGGCDPAHRRPRPGRRHPPRRRRRGRRPARLDELLLPLQGRADRRGAAHARRRGDRAPARTPRCARRRRYRPRGRSPALGAWIEEQLTPEGRVAMLAQYQLQLEAARRPEARAIPPLEGRHRRPGRDRACAASGADRRATAAILLVCAIDGLRLRLHRLGHEPRRRGAARGRCARCSWRWSSQR